MAKAPVFVELFPVKVFAGATMVVQSDSVRIARTPCRTPVPFPHSLWTRPLRDGTHDRLASQYVVRRSPCRRQDGGTRASLS